MHYYCSNFIVLNGIKWDCALKAFFFQCVSVLLKELSVFIWHN